MGSNVLRIVAIVAALAGLIVLLSSPGLGQAAGHAILQQNGGSMDTNTYLAQMQAATTAYQFIGAALLTVGLFRALQR